ncbi:MAG: rRNA maturation RNase YbeY [Gammaproteobacteria bacterium]|nr:rRNA maturation RNase YbeY [Gammaproteobacteria bacterium]
MKVMVEIDNRCASGQLPGESLCQSWLKATLNYLQLEGDFSVSLQFLPRSEAQALNRQYRGKSSATNVLSFPAQLPTAVLENLEIQPLGDIAVCPELVESEAVAQNKSLESHWAHILIHGMLHLLGHDHVQESAATAMETIEIGVLKKFGIANPYLIG